MVTHSLISQMRNLKFREFILVQVATLGSEIGSLWLLKLPFSSVSEGLSERRSALLACSQVPVRWAFSRHWPEIFGSYTVARSCVCKFKLAPPKITLSASLLAELAGRPEVLLSECLQKWDLTCRLARQFPSSAVCSVPCIVFPYSGHQ